MEAEPTAKRPVARHFYVGLALAVTATAFAGFYFTYFAPLAAGIYPTVPVALHVHGWTFFLWYLLFPLQALLIATRRHRWHFALGASSIALAVVMVFTGLLAASARIEDGLGPGSGTELGAFWKSFGLVITFALLLFAGFYAWAIARRRQPEAHKRLLIMASAPPLAAAVFRILVAAGGFNWLATPPWVLPAAFFLPDGFILAGMAYDFLSRRAVHRIYLIGLPIIVAVQALGFALATSGTGDALARLVAAFSVPFGFLY